MRSITERRFRGGPARPSPQNEDAAPACGASCATLGDPVANCAAPMVHGGRAAGGGSGDAARALGGPSPVPQPQTPEIDVGAPSRSRQENGRARALAETVVARVRATSRRPVDVAAALAALRGTSIVLSAGRGRDGFPNKVRLKPGTGVKVALLGTHDCEAACLADAGCLAVPARVAAQPIPDMLFFVAAIASTSAAVRRRPRHVQDLQRAE